jgi:hypothetical protein
LYFEKELFFSLCFFKRKDNGEKNTKEKIEKSFPVKKKKEDKIILFLLFLLKKSI